MVAMGKYDETTKLYVKNLSGESIDNITINILKSL